MSVRRCGILLVTNGLLFLSMLPKPAAAQNSGASVTIDEAPGAITMTQTGFTVFNPDIEQAGIGVFGVADFHGEYKSATPLNPGVSITTNFNILEPPGGGNAGSVSDTMGLTFSGRTPDASGDNLSIDAHFRSTTLDGIAPPALSGGVLFTLTETGEFQALDSDIATATGITDFHLQLRNALDVPEPGNAAMLMGMISGSLLLGARRLRRR
jgi:hypothetical protein